MVSITSWYYEHNKLIQQRNLTTTSIHCRQSVLTNPSGCILKFLKRIYIQIADLHKVDISWKLSPQTKPDFIVETAVMLPTKISVLAISKCGCQMLNATTGILPGWTKCFHGQHKSVRTNAKFDLDFAITCNELSSRTWLLKSQKILMVSNGAQFYIKKHT